MEVMDEIAIEKYPDYKDSGVEWLGEIPKHWELKPGFAVLEERTERNIGMQESQVLSLSYGKVIVKPEEKLTGLVPESFETYQIIHPGDIIIRPTDLQNDRVSLRTGLSKNKGIITSAYIALKIKGNNSSSFYHYFLHTVDITKIIYGLGTGLRQNLSFRDFARFKFLAIPKEEQTAIARFLDTKTALIDKAVAIKEKQIELLKERQQILIHRAVTRGLDPNVKFKDSGVEWIGEIPEHWEVKRLKYISSVQSGITLGKSYVSKNLKSFPYLRVANVQSGYFKLDDIAFLQLPQKEAERYFVKKGDILVTEGGDLDKLGRGTVWNNEIENCLHQNHVFAVRVNRSYVTPEYTSNLMESDYGRKYFTLTANKTTNLASTNSTKLGNFPLVLPPEVERKQIINYIQKEKAITEKAVNNKEKEIEKLKEYKSSLTNSAVTGKIKVW